MQNVITHSQKKSEKLKAVVSGHQELAAPGQTHIRRADEELLSAEGARHAKIGKDSRDLATQERPAKPQESQLRAPRTTRGAKEGAPGAAQRAGKSAPR
jgi:hypothetical protein